MVGTAIGPILSCSCTIGRQAVTLSVYRNIVAVKAFASLRGGEINPATSPSDYEYIGPIYTHLLVYILVSIMSCLICDGIIIEYGANL